MKTVVFNQYFGLGDILFLIPLARWYKSQGFEVLFPVLHQYEPLQSYFADIKFIPKELLNIDYERKDIVRRGDVTIIPFRWSNVFMDVPYRYVMAAKYDMVGADYRMWTQLTWKRNYQKEKELEEMFRMDEDIPTQLINEYFGNDGVKLSAGTVKIPLHPNCEKFVTMKRIDGYSLLDWAGVIEKATVVSTVHTSLQYMLEVLQLKQPAYIFIRRPLEENHNFYKYLFGKKYYWE